MTATGFGLSGADAGNYALTQPTGLMADITAASLTVTGLTADNKVYDTLTDASWTGGTLTGVLGSDTVSLNEAGASAAFADKNAGTGKTVTATGFDLSGADAGNYALTQPTGLTADITAASLTVTGLTADNKVYDTLTDASWTGGTLTGVLGTDVVSLDQIGASAAFADKNAGTGKTVTATGFDLSGADAGNYALTQPTGLTADITPASLTVTGLTADNKVYDTLTDASWTGGTLSGVLGSDTVSLNEAGASAAFADKNAGTGKTVTATGFGLSGADAGNYALTQPTGLMADITAASLTVTGLTADNKVYDTLTDASWTGGTLSGVLGSDTVSLNDAGASAAFADKNAGTGKTVTATGFDLSGADAGNYALTQPTGLTADITPASLTVTGLTADNKVYDTLTDASWTGGTLSGVLGSDTVSLNEAGASAAFADKNAGTGKTVTATGFGLSGADAGNYALTQPTGLMADITAASLTVTGLTADNKVYDTLTDASWTGGTLSGVLGSDTVSLNDAGASAAFADKNAGTGKTVTATGFDLSGADAGNYALTQPTGLMADITPASLTVTGLTADNKVYDTLTDASWTGGTLTGVLGSDTVSLNDAGASAAFADKNAGTGKTVTATGFDLSGADAGNYALTQPTGLMADITAASLTVTGLTADNKVYDTLTDASWTGGTLSGVLGSDTVSLNDAGTSAAFADKNAGTGKTVTATGFDLSGADAGNYALTQPTGLMADITPASLTVTGLTADNKVYDTLTDASWTGGTLTGVLGSDTVSLNDAGASAAFADKNAGTGKTVTATGFDLSGADAGNYALTQPTGLMADITAASLTVTGLTADNKVYDTLTDASWTGGTLSGVLGSDTVSLNDAGASAAFADKNAGTGKTVTATGFDLSGADAGNYALTQPTGLMAEITAASLTVTGLTADNKVYDTLTDASWTGGTLSGVLGSDTVSLNDAGASAAFADKNAGTGKTVTATGFDLSGADAGNYALTQPTGLMADITPASLTVTGLTADNKVYDTLTDASWTGGTLSGVLGSDTVSLNDAGASAAFADKNAGTGKTVTATGFGLSGADAGNYALTQPTGLMADITPASLTVTGLTADNKVYDTLTDASWTGGTLSGVLGSDTVSLNDAGASAAFADKNAGTGKTVTATGFDLSGADAGNYALTQPTGLMADITPASLTVTGLTADNKVYDTLTDASWTGGTLSGVLGSDTVSLNEAGASAAFADKNAGTGKTVTATGFDLSGADAGNYALTQPTGLMADITPASLTVTGLTADNKVYDTLTDASWTGGTLTGVLGSDTVSLNDAGASAAFADKNAGTGKTVTATGFDLSGADAGNYALTQPTGLMADITAASLTVTGLTADNKVYDTLTDASWTGGTLSGVLGSDTVSLNDAGASAAFADKNAGTGKTVTATGFDLSGADAGNYALTQPTGLMADITAASLTVTGLTADNKVYDTLTDASWTGGTLSGVLGSDTVSLNDAGASAAFADKNAGTGKTVTATGFDLSGADAGNYALTQPTGLMADITPASLTVTGLTADNKVYDTLTDASWTGGTLSGVLGSDTVSLNDAGASAAFADKNAGTGKTVTATGFDLSGADAGNYALTQPTGLTAEITAASLTVTGLTADNKVYDTLTDASWTGGTLTGVLGTDVVSLDQIGASAAFADKNAGTGKTVTATGFDLSGADAGNYALTQGHQTRRLRQRIIARIRAGQVKPGRRHRLASPGILVRKRRRGSSVIERHRVRSKDAGERPTCPARIRQRVIHFVIGRQTRHRQGRCGDIGHQTCRLRQRIIARIRAGQVKPGRRHRLASPGILVRKRRRGSSVIERHRVRSKDTGERPTCPARIRQRVIHFVIGRQTRHRQGRRRDIGHQTCRLRQRIIARIRAGQVKPGRRHRLASPGILVRKRRRGSSFIERHRVRSKDAGERPTCPARIRQRVIHFVIGRKTRHRQGRRRDIGHQTCRLRQRIIARIRAGQVKPGRRHRLASPGILVRKRRRGSSVIERHRVRSKDAGERPTCPARIRQRVIHFVIGRKTRHRQGRRRDIGHQTRRLRQRIIARIRAGQVKPGRRHRLASPGILVRKRGRGSDLVERHHIRSEHTGERPTCPARIRQRVIHFVIGRQTRHRQGRCGDLGRQTRRLRQRIIARIRAGQVKPGRRHRLASPGILVRKRRRGSSVIERHRVRSKDAGERPTCPARIRQRVIHFVIGRQTRHRQGRRRDIGHQTCRLRQRIIARIRAGQVKPGRRHRLASPGILVRKRRRGSSVIERHRVRSKDAGERPTCPARIRQRVIHFVIGRKTRHRQGRCGDVGHQTRRLRQRIIARIRAGQAKPGRRHRLASPGILVRKRRRGSSFIERNSVRSKDARERPACPARIRQRVIHFVIGRQTRHRQGRLFDLTDVRCRRSGRQLIAIDFGSTIYCIGDGEARDRNRLARPKILRVVGPGHGIVQDDRISKDSAAHPVIACGKGGRCGAVIGLRHIPCQACRQNGGQLIEDTIAGCLRRCAGAIDGVILLEVIDETIQGIPGRAVRPDQPTRVRIDFQCIGTCGIGECVPGQLDRVAACCRCGERTIQHDTGGPGCRPGIGRRDRAPGHIRQRDIAAVGMGLASTVAQGEGHCAWPGINGCAGRHRDDGVTWITLGIDNAIGEQVIRDQRDITAQTIGLRCDIGIHQDGASRLQGQGADRRGCACHGNLIRDRNIVRCLQCD